MVVNRVFCYSKEVAKKNGNNLPIMQLVLTFVIGISAIIMLIILLKDNFNDFNSYIFYSNDYSIKR